jgi:hypothetical protein
VKRRGNPNKFKCSQEEHLKPSIEDIGLTRKQIHIGRKFRNACGLAAG